MDVSSHQEISQSITRYIRGSRKTVTLLFTDIEKSTRLWEKFGDVQARLVVDRHNRQIFSIVGSFRGRVIKTIGDEVMASFRNPVKAVRAAIAIQQWLREEQKHDPGAALKVRIGVHTGDAIVEKSDIYGDAVNVASRVEEAGKGGQIFVTEDTAGLLRKRDFIPLVRGTEFIPRGKTAALKVYRCDWERYPDLISGISSGNSFLMVIGRQKKELLVYLAAIAGLCVFLYRHYLRFFLGDLNAHTLQWPPFCQKALFVVLLAGLLYCAFRAFKKIWARPYAALSGLKGGFGAAVGFFVVFLATAYLPRILPGDLGTTVFSFDHDLVEVIEDDDVRLRLSPSFKSTIVGKVKKGDLLYPVDEAKGENAIWNQVRFKRNAYAYVARTVPEKIGEPEKRISRPVRFVLRVRDLASFLIAFAGFAWGFITFKLRPA